MKNKGYCNIAATIFLVIAVVHGIRIIRGWDAVIGGVTIPMWASWLAVIIAGCMALCGYKIACKR